MTLFQKMEDAHRTDVTDYGKDPDVSSYRNLQSSGWTYAQLAVFCSAQTRCRYQLFLLDKQCDVTNTVALKNSILQLLSFVLMYNCNCNEEIQLNCHINF
jgi:hypothetical protein